MQSITSLIFLLLNVFYGDVVVPQTKAPVYNLSEPDQIMVLETDLNEISGLSYAGGKLYAIQDEKGRVYTLNPMTGKIIDVKKCWGSGDYEGIEVVDDHVYVLKSNGNIYKSPLDDICEEKTIKIDLGFDSNWNFEGIGYDSHNKSLMIVAKRSEYADENEVFCLPLDDLMAVGHPCYTIIEQVLQENLLKYKQTWSEKWAHKLSYSFNPSGIAVDPENGDIYILSSPVRQLLLLTKNWEIKKILKLDSDLYRQPEGICFDTDRNLYIGNEARKGKPKILKFHPR